MEQMMWSYGQLVLLQTATRNYTDMMEIPVRLFIPVVL
jgi:hypothetical protein